MDNKKDQIEISQRDDWKIIYNDWDPGKHPLREALCTLGNGYFATRGAMEELKATGMNYPGTYLGGGYNRAVSEIQGKKIENEDLVNWPNWLYLSYKIGDGKWFDISQTEILEYNLVLNLKEGILERRLRTRDEKFRETTLISRRIVSMHDKHLAAIEWVLVPENWDEEITFRSGIDGDIQNNGVERYSDLNGNHLEISEKGELEGGVIYSLRQ
jgi:trehalose/maltose hydrolase-like predicted phosphorylase